MATAAEYLIENTKIKIDDEYIHKDPGLILRRFVADARQLTMNNKQLTDFTGFSRE